MAIEIYAGSRNCGKTKWLIEKSAKTGIPIAVSTREKGFDLLKKLEK